MAGALVGGAFLSGAITVLFDRMASQPVLDFFKRRKLSDAPLKKLKMTLLVVNKVLNDAEEKQIIDSTVKEWLDELKNTIYDAEDLLDEIATDASSSMLLETDQSRTSTMDKVRNFFSTSLNLFDAGIVSKIKKILDELEFFAKQIDVLGLKAHFGEKPSSQKVATTSLVDESGVYGRDADEKKIIQLLLSDDASGNDVCVLAIVGMGGVGKTTLTQLVYNDHQVEEHFDLKAWVCVSDEFDVLRITKTIFEAVISPSCDIKDLNMLQVKLKEAFKLKKFLLVLDDVWNENYIDWDVLRRPFSSGKKGSKIIVTTRSEKVALIMRTIPSSHHLEHLSDEDCWLLFANHAFDGGYSNAHPSLEVIGREIVKKCKGLPLGAKILGGLLRSKFNAKEWNEILKSKIWDLPNGKSNLLSTLRLSYHYLPTHLKRCFAYCSIFPKDFEFQKEEVVMLWMAEDFLHHPEGNETPEKVGNKYFHDLISRSFFQQSSTNKSTFIMHDLVNDLAQSVSGEFCFRLEGDSSRKIPEKSRHLSYSRTRYDSYERFEAFHVAKCLRTFLPLNLSFDYNSCSSLTNKVLHDLLPTLRCLRVLCLSHYKNISELPESIGCLKHLRYLNLSCTAIRKLPDSICTLFNLQTLMLSNCRSFIELPASMGRLINLRHLDVNGTNLKEMPMHMGRLKGLRTLSTFVVAKQEGCTITELRPLQHLRGALHIRELQKVVHAGDALVANMKGKKYVEELMLEWSNNTEDSQKERDVLDKLQPHVDLKKLIVKYYGGTSFPDWSQYFSLSSMVCLHLEYCEHCLYLPPLGQLPNLKELSIVGLKEVASVGPEFYGNGSSAIKPFGSLETLRFEEMLELIEWLCMGDESEEFPLLTKIHIIECPKLTGVLPSHLPSLTELVISECQELVSSFPRAPAISSLMLRKCDKVVFRSNNEISNVTCQPHDQITTLPYGVGLQLLSSVKKLRVSGTSPLEGFPPWLQSLDISFCNTLESLPEGMTRINTCLCHLDIFHCPSLRYFPKDGLPTTLTYLYICECRKLELFPSEETMHNYYTSLDTLGIKRSCDSLKSFPLAFFPKLNFLQISNINNLESLCIPEGHHQDLTSLDFLNIASCPKFVTFPQGVFSAPNLTRFWVQGCENLKSLPKRMHTLLPSLQYLLLNNCPQLESFPEGGLPSNLITLKIYNCDKISRKEWALQRLVALREFSFSSKFQEVESFPEEWLLPSTLTSLTIDSLPNLKYLDKRGLQHLTSLQSLHIEDCPKLRCFPEEGLPTSLSSLEIKRCPLLEQQCQRDKGEDWPKIAYIPCILINDQLIS